MNLHTNMDLTFQRAASISSEELPAVNYPLNPFKDSKELETTS